MVGSACPPGPLASPHVCLLRKCADEDGNDDHDDDDTIDPDDDDDHDGDDDYC